MRSTFKNLAAEIKKLGNPEKAKNSERFFKTGPGQYGEGDIFLGLTVPQQRQVIKPFLDLSLSDLSEALHSKYHEFRLTALLILNHQYVKATKTKNDKLCQELCEFYLKHSTRINNWDLVDVSARNVIGEYLYTRPRKILYKLAASKNLWERRIAIIATYAFIKKNDFADTLKISEILFQDKEDLMHKAVGWMLREVGKMDRKTLDQFLRKHYQNMPRTTLRYAIEHYPESDRQKFLKGKIQYFQNLV